MIEVCNLSWKANGKWCLREINFSAQNGRVLAIVGPNGAGKSSLLKICAGEMIQDEGEVLFQNRPLQNWSVQNLSRVRAVLPQFSVLNFSYEVWEVVALGRSPWHRKTENKIQKAILEEVMVLTGIEALATRDYNTLSGGEKQRVHLARVLAQLWPKNEEVHGLLLLDEPTSSLDLAHQHRVLLLAKRWADMGAAVILILHDLNLALRHADDILVLKEGRVYEFGPSHKSLSPTCIRQVFGIEAEVASSKVSSLEGLLFRTKNESKINN